MDIPISVKAQGLLDQGLQLKSQDDFAGALAQFRKAVATDPQLFRAHLEIGLICKARASSEPFLQRHAFEAFRHAAQLDLHHQLAHDEYILSAQKMNQLNELIVEYDNWIKHYPENELLHRCKKNLITISLALMPGQVNVAETKASPFLKQVTLLLSLLFLLGGFGIAFGAPMLKKNMSRQEASGYIRLGIFFQITGLGGLFVRSRMK